MRLLLPLLLFCVTALGQRSQDNILVYTRNGKGYVHDNIADSVAALKKMGAANDFSVDVTDDPALFTDANLKRYKAVVFSNTNKQDFTDDLQLARFKQYVESV